MSLYNQDLIINNAVSDLGCTVEESPYKPLERLALKVNTCVITVVPSLVKSLLGYILLVVCEKTPVVVTGSENICCFALSWCLVIEPLILGPNITGAAGIYGNAGMLYQNGDTDGAFYPGKETPRYSADAGSTGHFLAFQASRSNGLYGDSSTIQPKSLTALYIIRI